MEAAAAATDAFMAAAHADLGNGGAREAQRQQALAAWDSTPEEIWARLSAGPETKRALEIREQAAAQAHWEGAAPEAFFAAPHYPAAYGQTPHSPPPERDAERTRMRRG